MKWWCVVPMSSDAVRRFLFTPAFRVRSPTVREGLVVKVALADARASDMIALKAREKVARGKRPEVAPPLDQLRRCVRALKGRKKDSGTPSGCNRLFSSFQRWRACALTPGYYLSPLRGDFGAQDCTSTTTNLGGLQRSPGCYQPGLGSASPKLDCSQLHSGCAQPSLGYSQPCHGCSRP